MEYNNQSMMVDGANPSMLWGNIADYLQRLAKSMSKTLNKRQRAGNDITWAELDNINKELHHQLDVIISGNNNVKENRNMNKKLIRLTEADLHRIVKESVNRVLNEHQHPNDIKQMYLDFLDGEGYSKEAVEKIAEKMAEKGIESLKDGNREVLCIAFDQNDNLMYSLMQRGWKHIRR